MADAEDPLNALAEKALRRIYGSMERQGPKEMRDSAAAIKDLTAAMNTADPGSGNELLRIIADELRGDEKPPRPRPTGPGPDCDPES